MNGSRDSDSPAAVTDDVGGGSEERVRSPTSVDGTASIAVTNGTHSPTVKSRTDTTAAAGDEDAEDDDAPVAEVDDDDQQRRVKAGSDGGSEDAAGDADDDDVAAASEAETLITSPVKKKEAEKKAARAAATAANGGGRGGKKMHRHRIGGLPVPSGDGDDENDSSFSPAVSVERPASSASGRTAVKRERSGDGDSDNGEDLSQPDSDDSDAEPARSRGGSERPGAGSRRSQWQNNPRKRKHRASSVSLPNKRPSIDAASRKGRGSHLGDRAVKSPSPNLRSHRRAVSTQSTAPDGIVEEHSGRRRSGAHATKDSKQSKANWEESDASSEATSHGRPDGRHKKGVGRSTSTPGRPAGRDPKKSRRVNHYGFTKLAEACENGNMKLVKQLSDEDPGLLEIPENSKNMPLQIAALAGNVEVVDYLIEQGVNIHCMNDQGDTPLIDAAENGHVDCVRSLLRAGVDPLHQNYKGQHALDVVKDETDNADEIREAIREAIEHWNTDGAKHQRSVREEQRRRAGPKNELHLMAPSYENLMKVVQSNNREAVSDFLAARVRVDNNIIAAAVKTNDLWLLNILLAEMPPEKKFERAEKPMLAVLGTSHFGMVQALTELEQFQPTWRDRMGRSWAEQAEAIKGPKWRDEKDLFETLEKAAAKKERRSSSPITKREVAKRRTVNRPDDDSDEEDTPKRKNGRRLMSKRDMRRRHSVASSVDEHADDHAEPENDGVDAKKQPSSPPSLRSTPGRKRAASGAQQSTEPAPALRKRSLSVRENNEAALPTVPEKTEEPLASSNDDGQNDNADDVMDEDPKETEPTSATELEAATRQLALEDEQARASEARREAERAERAEREEAERLAEEQRRIEEARQREEREMNEAKRLDREQILATLPSVIAFPLGADSTFDYKDPAATSCLLRYATPLQVLRSTAPVEGSTFDHRDGKFWVLNVQAAPLIGQQGVELFYRKDSPGFEGSLAHQWESIDVDGDDIARAEAVVRSLPQHRSVEAHAKLFNGLSAASHKRMALLQANMKASHDAIQRIRGGTAALRLVLLDDVLRTLHPILRDATINVYFNYMPLPPLPPLSTDRKLSTIDSLARTFDNQPRPRKYVNGECINKDLSSSKSTVQVKVRWLK